jgi:hypothetical protein
LRAGSVMIGSKIRSVVLMMLMLRLSIPCPSASRSIVTSRAFPPNGGSASYGGPMRVEVGAVSDRIGGDWVGVLELAVSVPVLVLRWPP